MSSFFLKVSKTDTMILYESGYLLLKADIDLDANDKVLSKDIDFSATNFRVFS